MVLVNSLLHVIFQNQSNQRAKYLMICSTGCRLVLKACEGGL
ncbi:hypothetical protein Pint_00539 [Pistacia integerrima]|uniref:Uncharacterized protein n=2 Tax=Pistacia TaxID=55512 RepID=A0ACC1CD84_9ROSI|nr:hypothetical protein Pint_00539 [Pistacia integerrima]KAJ0113444.1 hypothetical protein Patl1_00559 [Pistacia atlantica]